MFEDLFVKFSLNSLKVEGLDSIFDISLLNTTPDNI